MVAGNKDFRRVITVAVMYVFARRWGVIRFSGFSCIRVNAWCTKEVNSILCAFMACSCQNRTFYGAHDLEVGSLLLSSII